MTDLLPAFLQDLSLRGRGPDTVRGYKAHIKQFLAWYGNDIRNIEIDTAMLKAYLAHMRKRGIKTSTIQKRFTSLGGYCDWLEEEGHIEKNPVPAFRKRYLQIYKAETDEKRCITIDECARIVIASLSTRNQAIIMLLAKTGMRVHELTALDVADIDLQKREIRLKPTPKRSNRLLFFDDEASRVLERWLIVRSAQGAGDGPLFTTANQERLGIRGIQDLIIQASVLARVGDPARGKIYITPHYFRIFFTTMLLRAGMPRNYVQELRGDADSAAIDIYVRIDKDALKQSYMACCPRLGV